MKIKPIPGFSALRFKEEAQARVQAELEALSPEERIRKIRESIEKGPLGPYWKRLLAAKRAEALAALAPEEPESAA